MVKLTQFVGRFSDEPSIEWNSIGGHRVSEALPASPSHSALLDAILMAAQQRPDLKVYDHALRVISVQHTQGVDFWHSTVPKLWVGDVSDKPVAGIEPTRHFGRTDEYWVDVYLQ
jgi:hypothetical protein